MPRLRLRVELDDRESKAVQGFVDALRTADTGAREVLVRAAGVRSAWDEFVRAFGLQRKPVKPLPRRGRR